MSDPHFKITLYDSEWNILREFIDEYPDWKINTMTREEYLTQASTDD